MAKKFTPLQSVGFVVGLVVLLAVGLPLADKLDKASKQKSDSADMCGSTPCPDWGAVAAKEQARAATERAKAEDDAIRERWPGIRFGSSPACLQFQGYCVTKEGRVGKHELLERRASMLLDVCQRYDAFPPSAPREVLIRGAELYAECVDAVGRELKRAEAEW